MGNEQIFVLIENRWHMPKNNLPNSFGGDDS